MSKANGHKGNKDQLAMARSKITKQRGRKKGQAQKPQCTAVGRKSGKRCLNVAIPGGTVCRKHGGQLPNVKAAADRRIVEAQDAVKELLPAATRELKRLVEGQKTNQMVKLQSIKEIFDRAGLVVVKKGELEIKGEYTFSIDAANSASDEDEEWILEGEVVDE